MEPRTHTICHIVVLLLAMTQVSTSLDCHCSTCKDNLCTVSTGACFVSKGADESKTNTVTGCLSENLVELMCNPLDLSFKCCFKDHCNTNNRFPRQIGSGAPMAVTMEMSPDDSSMNNAIIIVVVVCVVATTIIISLLVTLLCFFLYKKRQRKTRRREGTLEGVVSPEVRYTSHTYNSTPQDYCRAILPQSESIGSLLKASKYYGNPLSQLIQRSVAQQTLLEKSLGKGSYCHQYTGKWRRDRVDVRVFNNKQERYWAHEVKILQLPLMRHDYILSFIAADVVQKNSQNYRYLISEHHPRGTLRDYLVKSTLEVPDLLTIVSSLINGLEYIHSEILQQGQCNAISKPSIAHCAVNSLNVYVDKSGSCCWSNFSLSVVKDLNDQPFKLAPQTEIRYLPPEFLTELPPEVNFESLRRGDVYALGLLMWEAAQCCLVEGVNEEHTLPYSEYLLSGEEATPTKKELRRVVCAEGRRPHPPDQCNREQSTRLIVRAMQDCWCPEPSQRPTTEQLNKSLQHSFATRQDCNKNLVTVDKNGQPIYKHTLDQTFQ